MQFHLRVEDIECAHPLREDHGDRSSNCSTVAIPAVTVTVVRLVLPSVTGKRCVIHT
jgi:hypothetical protein